jgi:hypothetical protein
MGGFGDVGQMAVSGRGFHFLTDTRQVTFDFPEREYFNPEAFYERFDI